MGRLVSRNVLTGWLVGLEGVAEDCSDRSGMTVGSYAECYEARVSEMNVSRSSASLSCFRYRRVRDAVQESWALKTLFMLSFSLYQHKGFSSEGMG